MTNPSEIAFKRVFSSFVFVIVLFFTFYSFSLEPNEFISSCDVTYFTKTQSGLSKEIEFTTVCKLTLVNIRELGNCTDEKAFWSVFFIDADGDNMSPLFGGGSFAPQFGFERICQTDGQTLSIRAAKVRGGFSGTASVIERNPTVGKRKSKILIEFTNKEPVESVMVKWRSEKKDALGDRMPGVLTATSGDDLPFDDFRKITLKFSPSYREIDGKRIQLEIYQDDKWVENPENPFRERDALYSEWNPEGYRENVYRDYTDYIPIIYQATIKEELPISSIRSIRFFSDEVQITTRDGKIYTTLPDSYKIKVTVMIDGEEKEFVAVMAQGLNIRNILFN